MCESGNSDRKVFISEWRFLLSDSVSPMPWCSLSPSGDLSSLTFPGSLESLIGSGSKWRSSYLGTGKNDRRVFDVVAGSSESSCSSCSSVSYHFVPSYLPKHGAGPRGHICFARVEWLVLESTSQTAAQMVLAPPRLRLRHRRRLVGARYRLSCPRSVVPVWWSDVWLIRFGSWIPS